MSVLTFQPGSNRQDHFLYHLLLVAGGDQLRLSVETGGRIDHTQLLSCALFSSKPSVSTKCFRRRIRFAAGHEDFARIVAHFP